MLLVQRYRGVGGEGVRQQDPGLARIQFLFCKLKYFTRTSKSLLLTYLCVGSHVKSDGQTLVGLDARQSCVEWEFTNWNAHSVSTQVSQTQNTLPISHNNGSNIWLRPAILPGSNIWVSSLSNVYYVSSILVQSFCRYQNTYKIS